MASPFKLNAALWIFAMLVGIMLLILFLFPININGKESAKRIACGVYLKQLGHTILLYAEDNDLALPPSENWSKRIHSYKQTDGTLACPKVLMRSSKGPSKIWDGAGYALNALLSSKKTNSVGDSSTTRLVYESAVVGESVSETMPAYPNPPRHDRGNGIYFLDSHFKFMQNVD